MVNGRLRQIFGELSILSAPEEAGGLELGSRNHPDANVQDLIEVEYSVMLAPNMTYTLAALLPIVQVDAVVTAGVAGQRLADKGGDTLLRPEPGHRQGVLVVV